MLISPGKKFIAARENIFSVPVDVIPGSNYPMATGRWPIPLRNFIIPISEESFLMGKILFPISEDSFRVRKSLLLSGENISSTVSDQFPLAIIQFS